MAGQLYFADNLGVLRQLPSGHVALCATDPPFNSGRDYNIFIPDSDAMKTAFTDIWRWDDAAIATRQDIQSMESEHVYRMTHNALSDMADTQRVYAAVAAYLDGWDMMFGEPTSGDMASLRSYLTFMAPRIVEIRRVINETGSFYLHCDATASHYLKAMCDVVFGRKQFRNEIVWGYGLGGSSKRHFSKKHDVILFYSKTKDYYFDKPTMPATSAKMAGQEKGMLDYWTDIPSLNNMAKERLGYPTQKPVKLYERIVKASSNEGDIVLDPFCGCGTTIDAAAALNRHWIGIDLTVLSLEPIQRRLRERHGLEPFKDYPIVGYPTTLQELKVMLADGRNTQRWKDAEAWVVTRLGMRPTQHIGDGGIDGTLDVQVFDVSKQELVDTKAVCEVKLGKRIVPGMIRDFRTAMMDKGAAVGIMIGLHPISAGVKDEMRKAGTFGHNGSTLQRVQYWQITDRYFENPRSLESDVRLPFIPAPLTASEAYVDEDAQQIML